MVQAPETMLAHPCLQTSEQFSLLPRLDRLTLTNELEAAKAPLITADALKLLPSAELPALGLLGQVEDAPSDDRRLYVNLSELFAYSAPATHLRTDEPFTAVICGVQGSGKSHALSVLLESSLIDCRAIGSVSNPLATVAFNYSSSIGKASEVAHLSKLSDSAPTNCQPADVVVFVSWVLSRARRMLLTSIIVRPSSIKTMTRVYAHLPVKVLPFYLKPEQLNAERLLALMRVDDTPTVPLYMHSVLTELRAMGADGFNYTAFRAKIASLDLNDVQKQMLDLRLGILDSYIQSSRADWSLSKYFKAGTLVLVDLYVLLCLKESPADGR
jgi:hypothetical protein